MCLLEPEIEHVVELFLPPFLPLAAFRRRIAIVPGNTGRDRPRRGRFLFHSSIMSAVLVIGSLSSNNARAGAGVPAVGNRGLVCDIG